MTTDQINNVINKALFELDDEPKVFIGVIARAIKSLYPEIDPNSNHHLLENITVEMRRKQLIVQTNRYGSDIHEEGTISIFGKEVKENGGWLKHLENLKSEVASKKKREEIETKTAKLNLFQQRMFWILLFVSNLLTFVTSNWDWVLKYVFGVK